MGVFLKTYCFVSDLQMPYHDRKSWKAVLNYIKDQQPDEVVNIGDVTDYPQPSRWTEGTKAEFEGGALKDAEYTRRYYCAALRAVYSGPSSLIKSNHGLRPAQYFAKKAPALLDDEHGNPFTEDKLLRLDEWGIDFHEDFYDFAPGWTATHGHLGFSLSRYAGGTAIGAARKIGKSVVCGHTHKAGLISESRGYKGKVETITGLEIGNLMEMNQAAYLKYGAANWQQAFGIVRVDGKKSYPELVMLNGHEFTVNGEKYSA
ncbi:metallophosphoesterase family protein [Streptomyces sp. NBC_01500]|uniref:metallophosphoesterase family protein n=1 Tax=Streptomyces sp. NBC_01500 TaxID=2903886 RepID=UPI00225B5F4E|nr:metallophosphoesterase family protein [Streptomyces sp. NBC_01500]MCX4554112.1 metallophosphoesterase [Streptomyces sp. NBC_01500]